MVYLSNYTFTVFKKSFINLLIFIYLFIFTFDLYTFILVCRSLPVLDFLSFSCFISLSVTCKALYLPSSPTSSSSPLHLSAHHFSFCLSVSLPGSCSCMASLRPPLPSPSAGQAVHGAGLSLDQAQPHPPGKPARVPVLPGPRPGLVRPAAVHRRRLPSLHEGEAGLTAPLLHPGGEGAGEGNGRLLCPLSRSGPELPAHQRQPEVWAAGGSGPEDAALLGQRRVQQAAHLCGAEWLVGLHVVLICPHVCVVLVFAVLWNMFSLLLNTGTSLAIPRQKTQNTCTTSRGSSQRH